MGEGSLETGREREEGREGGRAVGTALGQVLSIEYQDFEVMRIVLRDCYFTKIRQEGVRVCKPLGLSWVILSGG